MPQLSDIPDIDKLLKFLRLDKDRIEIERLAVHSNYRTEDLIIDMMYTDKRTQKLKRSSILIKNGVKINEYPITPR